MKATYFALTLNPQQNDWEVLCYGHDAKQVMEKAREIIGDPAGMMPGSVRDIYRETEHINLRVVSKTRASKIFGVNPEIWYYVCDDAVAVS